MYVRKLVCGLHSRCVVGFCVWHLVNCLFTLLVFLSLFLNLFSLLDLIDQLEKVTKVEDHWLSLRIE